MSHQYDILEPGLALSGSPISAADLEGTPFGAILNVCDFEEPRYARGLSSHVQFIRRPINDIYPVPLPYLTLATLELCHLRREEITTLVHCQAGRSRSPAVVALYLMARDEMSWDEAVIWIRARRPEVQPNVFFETDRRRALIVKAVRALLRGDDTLLAEARRARQDLIAAFRQRVADPAQETDGWNLIDAGFAVGNTLESLESLRQHDFQYVLFVHDRGGDSHGPVPQGMTISRHNLSLGDVRNVCGNADLSAIVNEIRSARASERKVCLISSCDELMGIFVACLYLMAERCWDIGTAMWYIGSRRATLWQHVNTLWVCDWESLLSMR